MKEKMKFEEAKFYIIDKDLLKSIRGGGGDDDDDTITAIIRKIG